MSLSTVCVFSSSHSETSWTPELYRALCETTKNLIQNCFNLDLPTTRLFSTCSGFADQIPVSLYLHSPKSDRPLLALCFPYKYSLQIADRPQLPEYVVDDLIDEVKTPNRLPPASPSQSPARGPVDMDDMLEDPMEDEVRIQRLSLDFKDIFRSSTLYRNLMIYKKRLQNFENQTQIPSIETEWTEAIQQGAQFINENESNLTEFRVTRILREVSHLIFITIGPQSDLHAFSDLQNLSERCKLAPYIYVHIHIPSIHSSKWTCTCSDGTVFFIPSPLRSHE